MTDASNVRRYRHLPTEVQAVRWDGDNLEEITKLTDKAYWNVDHGRLYISADGGTWPLPVSIGMYVIKNDHDVYPAPPSVIEEDYEPVDDGQIPGQLTLF